MAIRILPALFLSMFFVAPVAAQSVNTAQPVGTIEGREGETVVIAAGTAQGISRTYRIMNLGDGAVSVGADQEFVDLRAGNTLDFMVGASALQVAFQETSELEYHLVAISPATP